MLTLTVEDISASICRELGKNISELTGLPITVTVKSREKKAPEELITSLSKNKLIVAIHSLIEKQKTHIILLLDISSARKISEILLLQAGMDLSDEEALDALREFGNIVFGTFASEISMKTGGKVTYTIPEVVVDYDIAIIESLIAPLAMVRDVVEVVNFLISSKGDELSFEMLTLPGE